MYNEIIINILGSSISGMILLSISFILSKRSNSQNTTNLEFQEYINSKLYKNYTEAVDLNRVISRLNKNISCDNSELGLGINITLRNNVEQVGWARGYITVEYKNERYIIYNIKKFIENYFELIEQMDKFESEIENMMLLSNSSKFKKYLEIINDIYMAKIVDMERYQNPLSKTRIDSNNLEKYNLHVVEESLKSEICLPMEEIMIFSENETTEKINEVAYNVKNLNIKDEKWLLNKIKKYNKKYN